MSVLLDSKPLVNAGGTTLSIGQLLHLTADGNNPAQLVLNGFDRNEYTAGASTATGSFAGNGATIGLTHSNGDARENGIVFTYQAALGRYLNASYGFLDQLSFTTSSSRGDVTDLSLWGFNSLSRANAYATDLYSLTANDASGFLGSTTLATRPGFGPVPAQATPGSIAAIADGFVGQSWNENGCWVLTSTIAAEAGASLPVQSSADFAGQADGEWFVAFNGVAGQTGNWQSMVRAGDMIGFITAGGGGHITTCVAGAGSTATLVDNVTYLSSSGAVLNRANDGSGNDVTITPAHGASAEFAGVQTSSVIIYRLDTPVVTASAAQVAMAAGTGQSLAGVFSVADAAARGVTEIEAYLTGGTSDQLLVDGVAAGATSAASAALANSLADLTLARGTAGGIDTVSVRAFNGLYWGDWTSLDVTGGGAAPAQTTGSSAVAEDITPVYRFFEKDDGTHFFTATTQERDTLLATRPDLTYEGVGLNALTSPAGDAAAEPVYRFFDKTNGTHFFTADQTEQSALLSTRADLGYEGIAFYEDATPQSGDTAVYRFFESTDGTHLYTSDPGERATIMATRPDLVSEGIAFYAPA